jgi:TolB-like protein
MISGMIRSILAFVLVSLALPMVASAGPYVPPPAIKIAVLPFDVQGSSGHDWLGRALQEGLATGLQNQPGVQAVIVSGVAPLDSTAAADTAKTVYADLVIFGGVQVVDNQIRVNGQIISATSGRPVGVLRCDGGERDLFNLEDMLVDRANRLLKPVAPAPQAAAAPPVTLTLVGPTIPSKTSKYFDGNLGTVLSPPQKFRDEYDRYYYYSASSAGWGWCFGYGCGYGWAFGGCFGNGSLALPAGPVHGW